MKTYVYVDGFNLYYGALKGTPYKWLNIEALCNKLLPHNDIRRIKYYTARVKSRPQSPKQHLRQESLLRALNTIDCLSIYFGRFLTHRVRMPLANPSRSGPNTVEVIKTEEKGSDVNIAAHMVADAFRNEYEIAVLISNDSDLVEPIRIVREELGLVVGILNPNGNKRQWSRELRDVSDFMRPIRKGPLSASQFPDTLMDNRGIIRKPSSW